MPAKAFYWKSKLFQFGRRESGAWPCLGMARNVRRGPAWAWLGIRGVVLPGHGSGRGPGHASQGGPGSSVGSPEKRGRIEPCRRLGVGGFWVTPGEVVCYVQPAMTVYLLPQDSIAFPHPGLAEPDGLLAVGGDLTPERLAAAYARGIFPWYCEDTPILWWSPDPRLVLYPAELHVPRSLRRTINSGRFTVTVDAAFHKVVDGCAATPRPGQPGTWLLPEMRRAYKRLHRVGAAHSVETWDGDGNLAGGIYGVALGRAFFGESMFFAAPEASKTALVWLARLLERWGYGFMDCQQTTAHMLRFGAREIPRAEFMAELSRCRALAAPSDAWTLPDGFWPL